MGGLVRGWSVLRADVVLGSVIAMKLTKKEKDLLRMAKQAVDRGEDGAPLCDTVSEDWRILEAFDLLIKFADAMMHVKPLESKMIAVSGGTAIYGNDGKPWPQTTDVAAWATEFCKFNKASDHGAMIAWFASAIRVGYDSAQRNKL